MKVLTPRRSARKPPPAATTLAAILENPTAARTTVRQTAAALAREMALNLDRFWATARRYADGSIDVVDMFSGCGGMSAGFQAVNGAVAAYRLIAAVDIDHVANSTYKENLGLHPAPWDIAKISRSGKVGKLLERRRAGTPLVLIGCAPCQGFSSHRNTAGEQDARNSLFLSFARIAVNLCPDAIVVENVPELLTNRYWAFVTAARRQLERCGYFVNLSVHNMAEFGLPQERFRALLVAMRRPFAAPRGFLGRDRFRSVRNAIGALPPVEPGTHHPGDEMHYSAGHSRSTINTIRQVPKDGGSRPPHAGPECLRRAAKRNGRAVYEDVYGRLSWDRPAITVTAYARNPASGRFVHPEQDRGLTVREAALLQGFPSDYWFSGSLDQRFRQIGNAVPPAFAAFLATHLLGELMAEPLHVSSFDPGISEPVGPSFSRLIPALKAGHRAGV